MAEEEENVDLNPAYLVGSDDEADSAPKKGKKRKVPDSDADDEDIRNLKKAKKKAKKAQEQKKWRDSILNNPVQYQSTEQQQEYFWKYFLESKTGKNLSQLERNDYEITADSFTKPEGREEWKLEDLPEILQEFVPALKQSPPKGYPKGAPKVIIIAASAYRVIDIDKALAPFKSKFKVAKLFSKHKKVEEQVSFLKSKVSLISVGTPNRIHKLIQENALLLDECELIVLDMNLDVKLTTVLTLQSTRDDFYELYQQHLCAKIKSGSPKLWMM